jgi:4-amino-4-deoxy-L-arabinose transferase-like glycosyltransferase
MEVMKAPALKRALWLLAPVVYVLYFYGLRDFGLVGPDEPRYAAIAREMALSGDWITPRLWGAPWFEKPALLYWMTGAGFRAGLGPELAPRLPVALLSLAFLGLFWWILRREFGERAAWFSTAILGTCAGWLGFSAIGATDLPLAATFSAALLLAMTWLHRKDASTLPFAAASLGAAVLAKGLVPLVLILPLLWMARRRVLRRASLFPLHLRRPAARATLVVLHPGAAGRTAAVDAAARAVARDAPLAGPAAAPAARDCRLGLPVLLRVHQ